MSGIKIETKSPPPIKVGEIKVQPISQSVHWIERDFGLVWNRPYAIRVENGEDTHLLRIPDLTRLYLVILWGLTALFSLMFLFSKPRKGVKNE